MVILPSMPVIREAAEMAENDGVFGANLFNAFTKVVLNIRNYVYTGGKLTTIEITNRVLAILQTKCKFVGKIILYMKVSSLLICFLLFFGIRGFADVSVEKNYVQLSGNAYITSVEKKARITQKGVQDWKGEQTVVSVYFGVPAAGMYDLSFKAKGEATMKVSYGKSDFKVKVATTDFEEIPVGKIKVEKPGYICINLAGVWKSGDTFADIEGVTVSGPAGGWVYVKDFSDYWGRRGPSVHLKYTLPKQDVEWFYNEVTVPDDGEIIGSYYMVNGFGEGYFGMQYNSLTERRILFSVWSPFDTQDPKKIPEGDRIRVQRKGKDVHIGEFGNEGSGGQSYLKYNWKAGQKYPFLMQVRPDGEGNTVYTAYFYATDEGQWRLIASFLRPKTNTWYRNAHSFLENFSPEQGYLTRRVFFYNQWSCDVSGHWEEVVQAGFTYDATAGAGVRKDYQGGVISGKGFYLKNGGFFNEPTTYGMVIMRDLNHRHPDIDFESLKKL